jgi:hypothetical protein
MRLRFPIDEPKPTVEFDRSKAPPEGTAVVVRIRPGRREARTQTQGSAGVEP